MRFSKVFLTVLILIVIFSLMIGSSSAAETIEWVAGVGPGGATDTACRTTAIPLRKILDRDIIVINKSGAGGLVAMDLSLIHI